MTVGKLYAAPPASEELPLAQVLMSPKEKTPSLRAEDPKAYAVYDKNYRDDVESGESTFAPVVPEAAVLEHLGWNPETRRVFLRKVYSILTAQLLLTGVVCAGMALHVPTQTYVLSHQWPVWSSLLLSVVLLVALMCNKDKSPQNMYLLSAFTCVEAFLVGSVTTAYCAAGERAIVLEAVFLTGAIFVGLTLLTCQSKIDFSFLGAGLSMGLGALILWGLFAMIFGVQTGYVYALAGCIIFSGYILFDTWLIMDKLSPHEHVLAAIMLYLDIINLFLYILRFLSEMNRR